MWMSTTSSLMVIVSISYSFIVVVVVVVVFVGLYSYQRNEVLRTYPLYRGIDSYHCILRCITKEL